MSSGNAPKSAPPDALEGIAGVRPGGTATLDNCERELIHVPGAIQPHGGLVAFEPATGAIVHASANVDRWLRGGGLTAHGHHMADLFGAEDHESIVRSVGETTAGLVRHRIVELAARPELGRTAPLEAAVHQHGGLAIVELETCSDDPEDWLQRLGETIEGMRRATDLDELVALMANRVKRLLGFDRVMVYRFDAEWNGRVLADAREPDMESFLDLHYPASDIPAQARELYCSNLVRYIADVDYDSVPVVAIDASGAAEALDMSHCMLRSVSPVHVQYLRNMGVQSTLTLSLLVEGRLWGLVSAHHRTPTRVALRLRQACFALAVSAGYMIGWAVQRSRADRQLRDARLQARIVDAFNQLQVPLSQVVAHSASALQRLVNASGGALWRGGECFPFGQWPSGAQALAIMRSVREHLERSDAEPLATDRIASMVSLAEGERQAMCGLLALPLEPRGAAGIVWLRPEWRRQVDWGGDPNEPAIVDVDAHGRRRLSPRSSFARWSTIVAGRSRPWSDMDIESARLLTNLRDVLRVRESLSLVSLGERRFRSLIALQSDVYWRTDLLGNLLSMSKALPFTDKVRQGVRLPDLLRPHVSADDLEPLERALSSDQAFRDLRLRGQDDRGERFELMLNGEPVVDRQGRFTGWHGTVVDCTHEMVVKDAQRRRMAAEIANREKSRFLSQISHELRTPLNAVLGFSQLLLAEPALPEDQRTKVEHIRKAGKWLLEMVSDLLELSRIEAGDLPIALVRVDAVTVLREAVDLVRAQAASDDIEIRLDDDGDESDVLADPVRLKQVAVNLISNAVKYNQPHGRVRVMLRADPVEPHIRRIEVHDTGAGMTPEQMAHLFEAFNRLGREKQNIQGTGIGLVIAKRLVEAMGGRLGAESQPGVGSCFTIFLPVADATAVPADTTPGDPLAAEADDAPAVPAPPSPELRLLYVEDDPTNAELMRAVVTTLRGVRFVHVDSAESGWEKLRELKPQLVLTDVNLAGKPGNWLMRQLRNEPALDRIHCVAVTADVMPESVRRLLQDGFDECWNKPLDLKFLARRIPVLLARPRATREEVDLHFDDAGVHDRLDRLSPEGLDRLVMGVVRMSSTGVVTAYNAYESRHAGLSPDRVLGRRFFQEIARCADNGLVAGRLRDEPELDVVLDYVFTFKMQTVPVRLRLLRTSASPHRYLLVDRTVT